MFFLKDIHYLSSMQINLNVSHGFHNLRGLFFVQTTHVLEAIKNSNCCCSRSTKNMIVTRKTISVSYQSCSTIFVKKLFRKIVDFTGPTICLEMNAFIENQYNFVYRGLCVCLCADHCVRGDLLNSGSDRIKLVTVDRQHD